LAFTAWRTWHNIASNAEALCCSGSRTSSPDARCPFLVPRAAPEEVSFYNTALALADPSTPLMPIIAAVKSGLMVVIGTSFKQMNSTEVDNWFSLPIVLGRGTQLAQD
jgi:hypothetical protein